MQQTIPKISQKDYIKYKSVVRQLILDRLAYLNQFYGYTYKRVAIRKSKTRWGSCSKLGNLNFNYRLIFLTPEQVDLIIVHELCHLGEFNHSKNFWFLVAKVIPNYKEIGKSLKKLVIK